MMIISDFKGLIKDLFDNDQVKRIIFSNLKRKDEDSFFKVSLSPYKNNDELKYQFTYHFNNRVVHSNLDKDDAIIETINLISNVFKQAQLLSDDKEYHFLSNKNKKINILVKNIKVKQEFSFSHNKEKQYLIKENTVIPFLVELGVTNSSGKVLSDKYDKFKQINRFIEFVDDIVNEFDSNKVIKVIDFGCGKSYLTFAIHYYLTEIKKYKVDIVGLDLKDNVIKECNEIVSKYNLKGIKFKLGDIKDYKDSSVDLVVTLHACDIATDYALYNAIKWNAKVILSVPCCQHELNSQIKATNLKGLTEYGLIKERVSSLITDVVRANLLTMNGYKTQLLEFIDFEHTPKNLLIRAVKNSKNVNYKKAKESLASLKNEFNFNLTLEKLLENN